MMFCIYKHIENNSLAVFFFAKFYTQKKSLTKRSEKNQQKINFPRRGHLHYISHR
uniref:Uncharacterized protein n=1 Tax=Ascaris lumbricoides TaxID=6252 RepID=A0A0M3ITL7_ASCLU